jgi:SAM-dependent methyltransferase
MKKAGYLSRFLSQVLHRKPDDTDEEFLIYGDNLKVIKSISPDDGMFVGNSDHYFSVGFSALRCIRIALTLANKQTCRTILDLPCGHGRVLRFLKAEFPDAQFTACDLQRSAVDFCAEAFGAAPAYANEDPAQTNIQGPFDLIWCGSLLTHLDQNRWCSFLSFFEGLLSPRGVLVFTTHGRLTVRHVQEGTYDYGIYGQPPKDLLDDYHRSGFGFANYPNDMNYGISASSPSWVLSQLERLPKVRILTYIERGWDDHQDVVASQRSD